jgi:hypothetical protein
LSRRTWKAAIGMKPLVLRADKTDQSFEAMIYLAAIINSR